MSEKEKTNKKWTSSDKYRDNWDAIFKKHTYVPTTEEQAFIDSHTDDKVNNLITKYNEMTDWEESLRESLHEERLSKILEEKHAK